MTTFARARLRRITTLARLPTSREPDDVFRWMIPTGFSGGLSSAPSLIKARAAENIPTPTVASTTPGVSLSAPVGDLCSDPVESEGTPAPLPAPPPPPLHATQDPGRPRRGHPAPWREVGSPEALITEPLSST